MGSANLDILHASSYFVLMATQRDKLKNVAFGGDWSETLSDVGTVEDALSIIEQAARDCSGTDVRSSALDAAFAVVRGCLERGDILEARFHKALEMPNQNLRQDEASQIAWKIRLWLGRSH